MLGRRSANLQRVTLPRLASSQTDSAGRTPSSLWTKHVELRNFGLARYPFEIIPPGEPTERWADRAQLRADLQSLIGSWSERKGSGVYLLWADLGAGKTHAMRHL